MTCRRCSFGFLRVRQFDPGDPHDSVRPIRAVEDSTAAAQFVLPLRQLLGADDLLRQRRSELMGAIGVVGSIQLAQSKAFAQRRHQLRSRRPGLLPLLLGASRCRSDSPRSYGATRRRMTTRRLWHPDPLASLQLDADEGRGLLRLEGLASVRIRPRFGGYPPVAQQQVDRSKRDTRGGDE